MIEWFGLIPGLLTLALLSDGMTRILRPLLWSLPGAEGNARLTISTAERLGVSLLLGVAVVPWIVMLFDVLHVPIHGVTLFGSALLIWFAGRRADGRIGVRFEGLRVRVTKGVGWWRPDSFRRPSPREWTRSPAALVLGMATAALVLFSVVHVSLVPVRNYDALVGYDLVGKILAKEGRLVSSVFERIVYNAQCVYPPFTSGNNGFWYSFLPPVPRLWVPILAAGFLLAFWGVVRRWTGSPTAASLAAFLVFLPPALVFQLTVAQTDLPSMVFTALATFAAIDLAHRRGNAWPATLFLLAATTARTENVVFGAALAVGALLFRVQRRRLLAGFLIAPAAFFVLWNGYFVRHRMGYDPAAHFRPFDVDISRGAEVLSRAATIVRDPAAFGELSWFVVALAILWGAGRLQVRAGLAGSADGRAASSESHRDITGALLVFSVISFLFYLPYFYMWDPELNPLWSMEHTYKRGFFRFIPGLVAAFVAAPPVLAILRRCDCDPPPDPALFMEPDPEGEHARSRPAP